MTFTFSAKKRGKREADSIRASGGVLGVLYGQGCDPVSMSAEHVAFVKLYDAAGESSLIDLSLEGEKEPIKVLIQDVQYDPVKRGIIHFDLRRINMNKEMEVSVELNFIGEAPAVKSLGGTLVKTVESLNVKCLPKDLVSQIDVELGVLATFSDTIRLKDLKIPAGFKLMDKPEMVIAKVLAPLTEEQLKAMEEEGKKGVEVVEKVEKKVKEGEEEEVVAEGAKPEVKKEEKKEEKKGK